MNLEMTHHNMRISFSCEDESTTEHLSILARICDLVGELQHHDKVSLIISSEDNDRQDVEEPEPYENN